MCGLETAQTENGPCIALKIFWPKKFCLFGRRCLGLGRYKCFVDRFAARIFLSRPRFAANEKHQVAHLINRWDRTNARTDKITSYFLKMMLVLDELQENLIFFAFTSVTKENYVLYLLITTYYAYPGPTLMCVVDLLSILSTILFYFAISRLI
jgi:hypothetical protein